MSKRGLPILFRILIPILGILLLAALALGCMHYLHNRQLIIKAVDESLSQESQNTLAIFGAEFAVPTNTTFNFLQVSQSLDDFIAAEKIELPMRRAAVERLFQHLSRNNGNILSIRFVDFSGAEKMVVSGGKRVTLYRSLESAPSADGFYRPAARLFHRLKPTPLGTIFFEGPFKDFDGRMTFLAGMSKSEPEVGGFGGAVIMQWDLTRFIERYSSLRILGQPAQSVISAENGMLLSPYLKAASPIEKSESKSPHSSAACRLGTDNAVILTVVCSLPSAALASQMAPMTWRTSAILLALFGISALVAFVIAKRISLPIVGLTRSVASIGAGDLCARVKIGAGGEIGVLVDGFNEMAEKLQETTVSRDSLVEEIARREKVEAALAAEKEWLSVTLRNIGDGVIATDTEGHVILLNAAAENLTGWTQGQAGGRPFREVFNIINEETGQVCDNPIQKVLASGAIVGLANGTALIVKNGTKRCIADSAAPILDQGGKIIGVVLVFRDITESKAHEQELRKHTDEMTRFTYAVSHDLKSPLVTVKAFVHYLEDDMNKQDFDGVAKDLGYINGATEKMTRLLDELLDFVRLDYKRNPPAEALLQEVVREALSLAAGRITARGVEVALTQERVILFGDRPRLLAVFLNLVDNAVKFMGEQTRPRVEIGVKTQGAETVIFVRDNGIGIDQRHVSKLFGLFEKLDAGAEGTGMGLAMVRRIVETHGGRIWIESNGPGQGTTFLFTLSGARRESNTEDAS